MTAGALHLIGGGWGGDGAVWRAFRDAAVQHAGGGVPRITVVVVRETTEEGRHAAQLVQALEAAGPIEATAVAVELGATLPDGCLDPGMDGLLVGGGLTPAYLDVLAPHAARIRALVAAGVPYAGFSAGAAIAPSRAIVGGWLQGGLPVVAEDVGEELADLTVRDGLGLLPCTVDVHAAQWGTLARLVALVDAGAVEWGVAIDEDTALVVDGDVERVEGAGNAWWAERDGDGVVVRREVGAGEPRAPRPLR